LSSGAGLPPSAQSGIGVFCMDIAHKEIVTIFLSFYQRRSDRRSRYIGHLLKNWLLLGNVNDMDLYLHFGEHKDFDKVAFRDAVIRAEGLISGSLEHLNRLPPYLRNLPRLSRPGG
jgi:hypothetical protein